MEKIHASKLLAGLVPAGKLTSDPEVELVTTDSREVKPGCIFVAFPGERFDPRKTAVTAVSLHPKKVSLPVSSAGQSLFASQAESRAVDSLATRVTHCRLLQNQT